MAEARIDLDAEFSRAIASERELSIEYFEQLDQDFGTEEVRRSAAEMELHHRSISVDAARDEFDFAIQILEIDAGLARVAGDEAGTTAVEAGFATKWQVNVQR